MKVKLKMCSGCNKPSVIWKNVGREKFCKDCYGRSITGVAKKSKNKPTTTKRIPTFSSKRAKKNALYSISRKKFLEDHPICQMKIDTRCTIKSTEVHHTAGRIEELLLDMRYWKAGCHNCHSWVETHPDEAKALGLSIDRLTIKK